MFPRSTRKTQVIPPEAASCSPVAWGRTTTGWAGVSPTLCDDSDCL